MSHQSVSHSGYLKRIYNPEEFSKLVSQAARFVNRLRKKTPFDAIAFRGSSGSALGFALSAKLKIPVIYVRKEDEKSHGMSVEGAKMDVERYIIVDDLVASGSTVAKITKKLSATCVGIVLYEECNYHEVHCQNAYGDVMPITVMPLPGVPTNIFGDTICYARTE